MLSTAALIGRLLIGLSKVRVILKSLPWTVVNLLVAAGLDNPLHPLLGIPPTGFPGSNAKKLSSALAVTWIPWYVKVTGPI